MIDYVQQNLKKEKEQEIPVIALNEEVSLNLARSVIP